jgi:hypothetical protein
MESMLTRSAAVCFCGLLIGSLQATTAHAVDPGYLTAVEADVAEFTSKEFQPPPDSTWLGSKDSEAAQLADLKGFSSFLRSKSPGSYIFYNKLPTEYQELLHKDYLATGDLDRVKQDIFKYTREMKK